MNRASVLASLVVLATTRLAIADASTTDTTTDDTTTAVTAHVTTGGGIGYGEFLGGGLELRRGGNAAIADGDLGVMLPICFAGACVFGLAPQISIAYHRDLGEHWFVGPRVGLRYEWADGVAVEGGTMQQVGRGWLGAGAVEAGYRWRRGERWDLTVSAGAGMEMTMDGQASPVAVVRFTFGR